MEIYTNIKENEEFESAWRLDINQRGGDVLITPLMYAIMEGKIKWVQILLSAGASVHTQDVDGNTALHYACMKQDMKSVKELIKADANYNSKNVHGDSPLMISARVGGIAIVQFLLGV